MRFSVVIPTYNRAALLRRTLESVRAQRYNDFEVIVVDDGSTDATQRVVEEQGQRVKVLRQANLGPGAARNLGISHATGDYVAFLDSDDIWFPWTLEVFSRLIEHHGRPAILSGGFRQFTDEGELSAVAEEEIDAVLFPDFLAARAIEHPVGSGTAVIRRDVLAVSGGFTTRPINGEDHDLILRLGTAAGFVPVAKPTMLAWRRHGEGVTANLARYIEGSNYLLSQEASGAYPGGTGRAWQRREIIGRHVRPVSVECLRWGAVAEAWRMYTRMFWWNVHIRRWRYLAGFPLSTAWALLRGPTKHSMQ